MGLPILRPGTKTKADNVRQPTHPTEADVWKATERLRHDLNAGTDYSRVEHIRIGVAIDRWLDSLTGLKAQTLRCYRLSANRIKEQFGELAIEDLKALPIKNWLESLPVSPSQRAHHRFVIRAMFQYAKLAELTQRENPCDLIRLKGTTKRRKAIVVLTPIQFKKLVQATRPPFDRLVLVTGMLGLRIGEALALKWHDFDENTGAVVIQRNWSNGPIETPKTETSATVLPVSKTLMKLIRAWHKKAESEWLFHSRRSASGLYYAGILQQKVLNPAATEAGLPHIGWHTLRHSYRSWLDAAKISSGVSKDMMRHADISTTMNVYGRSLPDGMRNAAEAVSKLLK